MIVKVWAVVLCAASVEVHVTVFAPSGNIEPDAGRQLTGTVPSTASVTVGSVQDAAAPVGPVASTVWLAGAVNTGPVVSGGGGGTPIVPVIEPETEAVK